MASQVDVCNGSLGLLGLAPITSIDDLDTKAVRCRQFWTSTVEALLRTHVWNFATWRDVLSRPAEVPAFGYAYYYLRPSDCLYLVAVARDLEGCLSDSLPQIRYAYEGGMILSDEETLYCLYVRRIVETGRWDSLFYNQLAVGTAQTVTGLTGTACGIYASSVADTFDNFNVNPIGTAGEHVALDSLIGD